MGWITPSTVARRRSVSVSEAALNPQPRVRTASTAGPIVWSRAITSPNAVTPFKDTRHMAKEPA